MSEKLFPGHGEPAGQKHEKREGAPLHFVKIQKDFLMKFDDQESAEEWAEDMGLMEGGTFVRLAAPETEDEDGNRHAYIAKPDTPKLDNLLTIFSMVKEPLREDVLDPFRGQVIDVPFDILEDSPQAAN